MTPPPAKGPHDRTPLYVRLPPHHAERLDRAAFELKASKQDIVTGLISRYVDRASSDSLRRILIEAGEDAMPTGRHSFTPAAPTDVLTLEQVADLLQVEQEAAAELADGGELPGRRIGEEWRFSRDAVLRWLAGE
jgi:excisionase family DNA binding protein